MGLMAPQGDTIAPGGVSLMIGDKYVTAVQPGARAQDARQSASAESLEFYMPPSQDEPSEKAAEDSRVNEPPAKAAPATAPDTSALRIVTGKLFTCLVHSRAYRAVTP